MKSTAQNLIKKISILVLVTAISITSTTVLAAKTEKADQPTYDFSAKQESSSQEQPKATPSVIPPEATPAQTTETEKPTEQTPPEPKATVEPAISGSTGVLSSSGRIKYSAMQSSIRKYLGVNPDARAWLTITNTNINTPIVNPQNNNLYYEKRSIEGVDYPNNNYKNYRPTATYTDYRVKLGSTWNSSSRNIVIYGHNWTNLKEPFAIGNHSQHTLFAQLPSYTNIDFAKKNPYIYFSTENMEGIWKVFAVCYIENDAKAFGYNTPNPSTEQYLKTLQEFKSRSIYNFDTELSTSDRILTLDTCIRQYANVGSGQRFVVVARLLRPDETDTQAVGVSYNQNVKKPVFK